MICRRWHYAEWNILQVFFFVCVFLFKFATFLKKLNETSFPYLCVCVCVCVFAFKKKKVVNRTEEKGREFVAQLNSDDIKSHSTVDPDFSASFQAWKGDYSVPEGTHIIANSTPFGMFELSGSVLPINWDSISSGFFFFFFLSPPSRPLLQKNKKKKKSESSPLPPPSPFCLPVSRSIKNSSFIFTVYVSAPFSFPRICSPRKGSGGEGNLLFFLCFKV